MAIFLTRDQIYRILQREAPENVYPDGPASAFFSTAENDSVADVAATAYGNLSRILENYFPATADEKIQDWIRKMFVGVSFDPSVNLQDWRNRIIAKVRKQPTITLWEVLILVVSYLPPGSYAQVAEYGCGSASSWRLGVSLLGIDTFLGFNHTFEQLGVDPSTWCDFVSNQHWILGVDLLGEETFLSQYTYLEVIEPQIEAYGYEIRIFGTEVTGTSLQQMLKQVNAVEPARSVHTLRQNLNLSDFGLNNTVADVDQFSGVDCITLDPTSTTGYTGRTT